MFVDEDLAELRVHRLPRVRHRLLGNLRDAVRALPQPVGEGRVQRGGGAQQPARPHTGDGGGEKVGGSALAEAGVGGVSKQRGVG